MKKIFLLLIIISNIIYSVTLEPMVNSIEYQNRRHIIFKVFNPTKEPVAVDFKILKLVDTQGKKEKREVTNKVLFYPSQFVLMPKESKNIRVRYVGKTIPKVEEVYRVIANELDIDIQDKEDKEIKNQIKTTIKTRFNYEGLLFVHQHNASSNLKIKSFKVLPTNSNKKDIELIVLNSGNASEVVPPVKDYSLIITINGKAYKLDKKQYKDTIAKRVLARKSNKIILKNLKLPIGKIELIKFEKD